MAIEKVRAYFEGYGMADRILEFQVSSATVELAAQALGCEPCRIAKTLSVLGGCVQGLERGIKEQKKPPTVEAFSCLEGQNHI